MREHGAEILYNDKNRMRAAALVDLHFLFILVGPMLEAVAINISAKGKFSFFLVVAPCMLSSYSIITPNTAHI